MYADDRQIVRNIRMTPLKPNKLMFWNLKLVLHTTTMSQWISFKKVHAMSTQRMCFLYLQPNIGEPLACWWFIHADSTLPQQETGFVLRSWRSEGKRGSFQSIWSFNWFSHFSGHKKLRKVSDIHRGSSGKPSMTWINEPLIYCAVFVQSI